MSKAPGMGWRTPAKHDIMNKELGREVGVLSRTAWRFGITLSVWYDLTAGHGLAVNVDGIEEPDAESARWEKGCSPGLLVHHAMGSTLPVLIRLYETAPATVDTLVRELNLRLPEYGFEPQSPGEHTPNPCDYAWAVANPKGQFVLIELTSGSGEHAVIDGCVHENAAVFVLHDPNAISEWAIKDSFAKEISNRTPWFRAMHTMGCNVGGLKRLPPELRAQWFDFIEAETGVLHPHHDMVIGAIERDHAQWAYMIRTSDKWRDSTADQMRKAFQKIGREMAVGWFRTNSAEFSLITEKLFRTEKERECSA